MLIIDYINRLRSRSIRARHHRSVGLRPVAKEMGISPTTLARFEGGCVPDFTTLVLIETWIGSNGDDDDRAGDD